MNSIIEQLPPQSTVFMRRIGAYGSENFKLMAAIKDWADQKDLLKNSTIYGIAYDGIDTPPEKCRYDVCLVVSAEYPLEESVQRGEIPGGKYVVFTIPHTAEAVQEFWGSFTNVLQEKEVQLDMARPILERYEHRLVEDGKCAFCVPII